MSDAPEGWKSTALDLEREFISEQPRLCGLPPVEYIAPEPTPLDAENSELRSVLAAILAGDTSFETLSMARRLTEAR